MKCHDSNGADAMWHASAAPGTASGSDMNAASSLIGASEVSVTDQRFSDTCENADAATSGWPGMKQLKLMPRASAPARAPLAFWTPTQKRRSRLRSTHGLATTQHNIFAQLVGRGLQ